MGLVTILVYLFINIILVSSGNSNEKEKFTEELYLKPLPNGDLLAHFSFDITSSSNLQDLSSESRKEFISHFNLMPKVVGEFLTDHALEGKFKSPSFLLFNNLKIGNCYHNIQ